MKHWGYTVKLSEKISQLWWDQPLPVDVEITSYALLTYMLRNDINGAVPLVRWLVSQQNRFGGFSSTQVY